MNILRVCDGWALRRQIYAVTFPAAEHCHCSLAGTHSFPVLPRVGGYVGLSDWLHAKTVYPRTVTYLSTNRARLRVTLLM